MKTEAEIIGYLKEKVNEGQVYFKSKYIAKDLDEKPKRIGQILLRFSQKKKVSGMSVAPWSCTFSITWRVVKI